MVSVKAAMISPSVRGAAGVGFAVGTGVGFAVGTGVGFDVGAGVGFDVGAGDSALAGVAVGAGGSKGLAAAGGSVGTGVATLPPPAQEARHARESSSASVVVSRFLMPAPPVLRGAKYQAAGDIPPRGGAAPPAETAPPQPNGSAD